MNSEKNNILKRLKRDNVALLLIAPAIICTYFFTIRPQITGMIWSFFEMNGYTAGKFAGLANYKRVIHDTMFATTLMNTFKYVFWSLIIGYLLPLIIAILLNETVHFRKSFRFWVYFPSILPAASIFMLWNFIYYPDAGGLLNMARSFFGLAPYGWLQDSSKTIIYIVITMTWSGAGATALYYFASLQGVSRELYEAALIDGAGFFKRLRHVTLPHISGIALLFLVRQIIGVFSVMEQPLQMTDGGPNGASMTLGLLAYRYGFVYIKPALAMSVGVIMFVILILATFFYYRLSNKIESNY